VLLVQIAAPAVLPQPAAGHQRAGHRGQGGEAQPDGDHGEDHGVIVPVVADPPVSGARTTDGGKAGASASFRLLTHTGDQFCTRLQCGRRPSDPHDVIIPRRPTAAPWTARLVRVAVLALAVAAGALLGGALEALFDAGDARFGITDAVLGAMPALLGALWLRERRTAAARRMNEKHFRSLMKASPDPIIILDADLRVSYASKRIVDMLGHSKEEMAGRWMDCVVHRDDLSILNAMATTVAAREDLAVRTVRVRHADGRWRLIEATVRDLRSDPEVGSVVLYCHDVSARTPDPELGTELLELSMTDPVTGLPNRAALVRRLGEVQSTAAEHPHAIALIGIDGLNAADLDPVTEAAVLRALTSRFTRALRGNDWLARGKGGDFVVLVDGTVADAETVAGRLVTDVGPLVTDRGTLLLSASAGLATLTCDVDTGDALRRGDLALRSARAAGPGSLHRYDDALRSAEDRRESLRADLDGALDRGEFRLVFQPVVDTVLQRTVSVEALLRWRHPDAGDVSPGEFVPLAEESPLISAMGRWVLEEACRTVAALPDPDLSVAVNVSARQVRSGGIVPDVLRALEISGLPASRLIVEITESVLLDDAHVIEDLAALRQLGVRIAVDDFGTGWSSLAYLVGMPVDVLKMDQHFLANVEDDPQARALCRGVLQLGTSLGLPVTVEGVTTEGQLAVLRDMGHRYLQGYVFSCPLEADALAAGAWRSCAADALAGAAPTPAG
jgi:PAS domain S-box-containing protein/diguanylate cyclase (GGDEF)-like protein